MRAAQVHGAVLRHDTVVTMVRGPNGVVRGVALACGDIIETDAVVIAMGPRSILAARWFAARFYRGGISARRSTAYLPLPTRARGRGQAPCLLHPEVYSTRRRSIPGKLTRASVDPIGSIPARSGCRDVAGC
jgi:phytoene dehydrogenase-like protein